MRVGYVEEIVQNFKRVNEDGWDADRFCPQVNGKRTSNPC